MKKIMISVIMCFVSFFMITHHQVLGTSHQVDYNVTGIFEGAETFSVTGSMARGSSLTIDSSGVSQTLAFWIVNGVIRSDLSRAHQFIVTTNMNLQVVFAEENRRVVVFMDTNGTYLGHKYTAIGGSVDDEGVNLPLERTGFQRATNKWISIEGSTSLEQINLHTVMMVNLVSTGAMSNVNVSVTNGSGQGSFAFNTVRQVIATEEEGKSFLGWYENDRLVSKKENYSFSAIYDRNLEARWSTEPVSEENLITMSPMLSIREGHKTFIGQFEVKTGYELVEYGFIFHKTIANEIDLGTAGIIIGQSSSRQSLTNEFSTSFIEGFHQSVRAYLIVKNGEGVLETEYSELYMYANRVNEPVLFTGMNPVYWDGDGNEITKYIDGELNPEWNELNWYAYISTTSETLNTSRWANAKTKDGSYWVWIPRYVYRISSGWSSSTTGVIDVRFVFGADDIQAKYGLAPNQFNYVNDGVASDSNNQWTSHPAFTFGTQELTGFWVAKFEASNNGGNPRSTPGVSAWRSISISNIFTTVRAMENNETHYGWKTNEVDSHMMRNSEWGAMAYLSHSSYGRNANEITINTNESFITGGGENDAWKVNQNQSSTGNLYGIYDINGGSWEYVAAYSSVGTNPSGNGAACVNAGAPYCEVYPTTYAASNTIKGDAVFETSSGVYSNSSWHGDFSIFPTASNPWFVRGGRFIFGANAGAFAFDSHTGAASSSGGFRPILIEKA